MLKNDPCLYSVSINIFKASQVVLYHVDIVQLMNQTLSIASEFIWEVKGTPAGAWGRQAIRVPHQATLATLCVSGAQSHWDTAEVHSHGLRLLWRVGSPAPLLAVCPANQAPPAGESPWAKRCASSSPSRQSKEPV